MRQHQGADAVGEREKVTLPPHGDHLAAGERFPVHVFRDHPEWDQKEKWWRLPTQLIEDLFICSYACADQEQLDRIANQHPGAVFDY